MDTQSTGEQNHLRAVASPPQPSSRADALRCALRPLSEIKPNLTCNYLIKGWLDRGAFSVVFGESNVGKSFFALDLALHIASRSKWYGHRVSGSSDDVPNPLPVIYIAGEGGRGIGNRIEAMRRERPKLIASSDTEFLLLPTSLDLCGPTDADALIQVCTNLANKPALIVIDTLARSMGNGDENTAKDMGRFIANCDRLRERLGCHVMVIHHCGKDASKGARGSSSLIAAVDTELRLTRVDGVVNVEQSKQRDMVANRTFSYRLRDVQLGVDTDGDPVTSAVIEQADPVVKQTKLSGASLIAMQALDDALAHHGERKSSDVFPASRKVVSVERWREYCDRHSLSNGERTSAKRTAFGRAEDKLRTSEMIRIVDNFVWRVIE